MWHLIYLLGYFLNAVMVNLASSLQTFFNLGKLNA
jgi:hypothetical protein